MSKLVERGGSSRGNRLRRAAGASIVSRGIGISASLLLTPIVIKGVGEETYGIFATITSLVAVAVVSDLGIGAGLVVRLAHASGRDDTTQSRHLVSSALAALSVLGLLLTLLIALVAFVAPVQKLLGAESVPEGDVRASVLVFALALGLGLPFGIGDRALTATQRGAQAALWSLASSAATLGATAFAAHTFGNLVSIVTAASLVPRVISAIESVVVLNRITPELRPHPRFVTRGAFHQLRTAGTLFLVQGLAMAIAFESDVLVVSSTLGATAAAIYSVNFRVITLVGSLAILALGQVLPAFAEALARGDLPWVRRIYWRLTWGLLIYVVALSVVLVFATPTFVTWWVGGKLTPPPLLLYGLVAWTAYTTVLIPANMLMNAAIVIRVQLIFAISMSALNLPLSIFLTRHIGVAGPVWGSLIAHMSVSVIPTFIIVRRLLRGDMTLPTARPLAEAKADR